VVKTVKKIYFMERIFVLMSLVLTGVFLISYLLGFQNLNGELKAQIEFLFLGINIFCLLLFLIFYLVLHRQQRQEILVVKSEIRQKLKNEISEQVARQVSHDIRSPLTALNMATDTLIHISDEQRMVIRNATQRINDIANQLLSKAIANSREKEQTTDSLRNLPLLMLSSQVDALVSDKRVQYRSKFGVCIQVDLKEAYGLFIQINQNEFKKTLSSLIDNAVESLVNESGEVLVAVRKTAKAASIIIMDNGKGLLEQELSDLGKDLLKAKTTIEKCEGQFSILSKQGQGSMITLTFPRCNSPIWFVENIPLTPESQIVALDDDQSIHHIWDSKINGLSEQNQIAPLISFTSTTELKSWYAASEKNDKILFLMDYEILGQVETGLDVIEELDLSRQAILVTSHFEEDAVQIRCKKNGVKLIPKSMANLVPFTFTV
jgi:signal transduction histidine kinase